MDFRNRQNHKFILFLFIVSTVCCATRKNITTNDGHAIISGCKLTIPTDIPENEPVYLIEKNGVYNFFHPKGRDNYFSIDDNIILFCPGKKNILSRGNHNQTRIFCKSNLKFGTESNNYNISRMNCTKEVTGDIRITGERCANNNGVVNELGFQLNSRTFIPNLEVCYNNDTASVIYVKHRINGKAIKHNVKENERRPFKSNGIPNSVNPSMSYKKNQQVLHFNRILGNTQNFINSTSFLSRGHLGPDADFVFSSGQFATYFYINVAPQFQIVNSGNWLKVENIARRLANAYDTDLLIITGVYEVLTLPDNRGNRKALFLEDDFKIEIPKWFWKVIVNEQIDSAIVIITSNNPFSHKNAIIEFCTNVCATVGLSIMDFTNTRKGYTFCCALNEFNDIVKVIPQFVHASKLLECSNISLD